MTGILAFPLGKRCAILARICAALVLTLGLASGLLIGASINAGCLECHQDPALSLTRGGREVSLFVDATRFAASRHGEFGCTDCHAGLDGDAVPHGNPVPSVNCVECHGGFGATHAFHPRIGLLEAPDAAPDVACAGCHGAHDIVARDDPTSRFAPAARNASCGACHAPQLDHFRASAHAGAEAGLFPDCLSCHQSAVVPGARPLLGVKLAQVKLCLACHVESPAAERTRLAGRFVASWGHSVHGRAIERGEAGAASCVDCLAATRCSAR